MNYGLYLSASGVLTNLYRQDVFANNLANVHTVGFKPDMAMIRQRAPESVESQTGFEFQQDLLDRLGGGVFAGPQGVNMTSGHLQETSGDLDAAIESRNAFFAVSVTNPANGQSEVQWTRDGRFAVNKQGYLVMVAGGHRVLDPDGKPIQLDTSASSHISPSADVVQNGEAAARIHVAEVVDPDLLAKVGGSRFRFNGPDRLLRSIDHPKLRPGFVEASGVDPIKALMDVINTTKTATANGNLIRYHDLLMDRAVNVLGRVTA